METLICIVFIGSLGYEAILWGTWLQQQQHRQMQQEEEEEILTRYEPDQQGDSTQSLPEITPQTTGSDVPAAVDHSLSVEAHDAVSFQTNPTHIPSSQTSSNQTSSSQISVDPRLIGWEFKIVRANRELFREPKILQRLCKEEAEAGWILLEKLDDCRVRFKRPIALRDILDPEHLPQDPYRCHYGSSGRLTSWLKLVAAVTAIVLPAYLGYALVTTINRQQPAPATFPSPIYPSPSLP